MAFDDGLNTCADCSRGVEPPRTICPKCEVFRMYEGGMLKSVKKKRTSFTNTEPPSHQSENTWFTPKHFIDTLGPFDLDPCTMSFRPFNTASRHVQHDKGVDGLKIKWFGDVWLNPPYGKEIEPFIKKFMKHRKGVMLIFARMGNQYVQELLSGGAYSYCLRRRVFFIKKDGSKGHNAGTDSMLVFFDKKYIKKVKKLEGILIKGCNEEI